MKVNLFLPYSKSGWGFARAEQVSCLPAPSDTPPRRRGVIWQSQEHREELALGLSPGTPSHATGFQHVVGWQEDGAFPPCRGSAQHRGKPAQGGAGMA